jgi:hypothetical protein
MFNTTELRNRIVRVRVSGWDWGTVLGSRCDICDFRVRRDTLHLRERPVSFAQQPWSLLCRLRVSVVQRSRAFFAMSAPESHKLACVAGWLRWVQPSKNPRCDVERGIYSIIQCPLTMRLYSVVPLAFEMSLEASS